MNRRNLKLSDTEIESVCRELLEWSRYVSVKEVQGKLFEDYKHKGKTSRVAAILKRLKGETPLLLVDGRFGEWKPK